MNGPLFYETRMYKDIAPEPFRLEGKDLASRVGDFALNILQSMSWLAADGASLTLMVIIAIPCIALAIDLIAFTLVSALPTILVSGAVLFAIERASELIA